MRILNLIQCTELGGMERASLRLMSALVDRSHTCHVVSLRHLGGLAPLLQEHGITAEGLGYRGPCGFGSFLPLRRRLRQIASQFDALLMTGHNLMAMLALGGVARNRRVLAVHYHHAGVKPDWVWRRIYTAACRRFNSIVFPSRFIHDEAVALRPEVAPRAHVVRNPLDLPPQVTAERRREAKRRLSVPPSCLLVGNAGWLILRKRWDIFLQVAREIRRRGVEARFVVAGDGPEAGRLKQLAGELELSEYVTWLGWRNDLTEFYEATDLLLFNSDWDAFPTTPQEAMAHGIPVVASALHGGLEEVFEQVEGGTLLLEHNVAQLADSACRMLNNRDLAERVGRAGREGIGRLCCPDAIARQYESFFETCGHHTRMGISRSARPAPARGRSVNGAAA